MTGLKRWQQRTAILLLAVLAAASLQLAQAQDATVDSAATLGLTMSEQYGDYLVDADGFTLYLLTADSEGMSTCVDKCAEAWPPLLTEGTPVAGGGLQADLLGMIEREDGSMQVTYNGHPLYRFVRDDSAGFTAGQDLDGPGGKWYLVDPSGEPITTAPTSG